VTSVAAGTATIWNVASATAAGATTASTKLITTFVEVRGFATHNDISTVSAVYASNTHGAWTTVDAITSAGFLSRSQRYTVAGVMGATVVPGATASNVQNLCSVTGNNVTVAGSIDLANNATCVLTRSTPSGAGNTAAQVSSTSGNVTTRGGNQVADPFTLYQYYRVSLPGLQRYSNPIRREITGIPTPHTVPTLVSVTSAPTNLATTTGVESATPISLTVYDQHGLVVPSGQVDVICVNATGSQTSGSPAACTNATTLTANSSGVINFYITPGAANTPSTVTVSKKAGTDAIYVSTVAVPVAGTAIQPGITATTFAVTGTPIAQVNNPTATFTGTITHTGVFPRNMTNAAAPYAFTIGGLTATNGATVTYNCIAVTASGGNTPSTFVTATYSAASGTPTCTLTPVLDATGAGVPNPNLVPVYVRLSATIGGSGFTAATPPSVVEVVVNRIP